MKLKTDLLSLFVATSAVSLSAAELNTPFESLPVETIAAARFDNSPEALQKYVDSTKLGKLILSDEKIAEYKAFIEKMIEQKEGENLLQKLGEVGLELDDLYAMITSQIGAALVMQDVVGHDPMPTILVWAEMKEGMAERAFNAILDGSAENPNIERTDHELAGAAGARIRSKADGSSFLIANLENRFIFTIGQVMEPIETQEAAVVFEEAELEALGYFLQAQQGEGGEFLSKFYSDPGVSSVRPGYDTRFEILGDVQQLMQFAPAESAQMIQGFGLDQFTKFAAWSGLVEMEERSVLFVGAPSPRTGAASLIDAEAFEFQPPAWVPSTVNTYSSTALDLPKLFDLFVSTAKKFAPPEMIEQQLAMANQQLQMMLQADLQTVLNSFGKRLHIVEYPIEMVSVNAGESNVEIPKSPQVMVMDFNRPEILQAGMAMISEMASNPASGMTIIDEQGFSGVRMASNPQGEVTIAHGFGKLVFAVGSEVSANRIFSALSNLPKGDEALVNDRELRTFMADSNLKPGIAFSFTRGDKVLKNLVFVLQSIGKSMQNSSEEGVPELLEEGLALLPAEEELDGVLGIGFTRIFSNEHGLIFEGLNEYK